LWNSLLQKKQSILTESADTLSRALQIQARSESCTREGFIVVIVVIDSPGWSQLKEKRTGLIY